MENIISNYDNNRRSDINPTRIKVIGVGGGGGNAVNRMIKAKLAGVDFWLMNTDLQVLTFSNVQNKLQLGVATTKGLGSGGDPATGEKAAIEVKDEITKALDGADMVFITAGMGGGTGTGAAPVVARIAKERGLLTIGIVTIPFLFEGKKKILKALDGADEMSKYVDAMLVINNERLTEIYGDLNFINAFEKADDTLSTAARSISEIITLKGYINLDFKDVETTLRDGGSAIISTGYGEGPDRVNKAIKDALTSPLLKNRDIFTSKKLLFNLYFSREAQDEFVMSEVHALTNFINSIESGVDVIWGVSYDESLGNKVKITILAAGFESSSAIEDAPQVDNTQIKIDFSAADKVPAQDTETQRLTDEYGEKIKIMQAVKEQSRYVVLQPNQFDDDATVEMLESTPAYNRDKKIAEEIRSGACAVETIKGDVIEDQNDVAAEPTTQAPVEGYSQGSLRCGDEIQF